MSRQPMRLDAKGWKELSAAIATLLKRANAIEAESQKRLESRNHDGEFEAGLVMMLFEGAPGAAAPVADAEERSEIGRSAQASPA